MRGRALLADSLVLDNASSQERTHASFFGAFFRAMDDVNATYCVLACAENTKKPVQMTLAIRQSDKAKVASAFRILRESGYWLVTRSGKSIHALSFQFCWLNAGLIDSAVLQLVFRQHACGRMLIPPEALLHERQRQANCWSASPAAEFEWLLARLFAEKQLSCQESERLYELSQLLPREKAESSAVTLFGPSVGRKVAELCRNRRVNSGISGLRRRLWMRSVLDPLQLFHYWVGQFPRRRENSRGALIVLLGPDGSGKSTIAGRLASSLRPVLARQRFYHWRPALLGKGKLSVVTTDPHWSSPRNALASSLYLAGFFFDHVLGFLFQIKPFLASPGLVIFDRHFCDVIADPRRYRYSGPLWLARLLARVVPPRDRLTLILEASDANTFSRKSELSLSELRRQREAYRKLSFGKGATTQIVVTDQGVESTLSWALNATLEYLADSLLKRYGCFN